VDAADKEKDKEKEKGGLQGILDGAVEAATGPETPDPPAPKASFGGVSLAQSATIHPGAAEEEPKEELFGGDGGAGDDANEEAEADRPKRKPRKSAMRTGRIKFKAPEEGDAGSVGGGSVESGDGSVESGFKRDRKERKSRVGFVVQIDLDDADTREEDGSL
jgi:hypothetical protein